MQIIGQRQCFIASERASCPEWVWLHFILSLFFRRGVSGLIIDFGRKGRGLSGTLGFLSIQPSDGKSLFAKFLNSG
ncbi:hypothetical protein L596_021077 [Steinernema carpocapsae]|uniref:Uncharacterized protein n=1 Tax=Steinernema carpocapsae TaxID=34508 RepID=A0A4U5MVE8_STECR|nr:hypothetical protein L596_021077 [Steinernema carpocapsae]